MDNRFEIIHVSSKVGNLTYECDICHDFFDYDSGIIWITPSYGVCEECRAKTSDDELDKLVYKCE